MLGCVRSSPRHCAGSQPCCSCRFSVTGRPVANLHHALKHTPTRAIVAGWTPTLAVDCQGRTQRSANCGNAVVGAFVHTLPGASPKSGPAPSFGLPAVQLPAWCSSAGVIPVGLELLKFPRPQYAVQASASVPSARRSRAISCLSGIQA